MILNLRLIKSIAYNKFLDYYRIFSLYNLGLRFLIPITTIISSWFLISIYGTTTEGFNNSTDLNYLTFVVTGNAFYSFVYVSLFQLGRSFQEERLRGTFEALLITPYSKINYFLGILTFGILNSSIDFVIIIIFGMLFLNINFVNINILILTISIFFLCLSLFGLGIINNVLTLTFRDRNNFANILLIVLYVFSGVFIPVEIMPSWARVLSFISPITYPLNLFRLSFENSLNLNEITKDLIFSSLNVIVYLFIGYIVFRRLMKNIQKNGETSFL